MVLLIAYDLHGPGRNYASVNQLLTQYRGVHPEGSVWLIDTTSETPNSLLNKLRRVSDSNDEFFVTRITNWDSINFDTEAVAWLNSPFRNW